MARENFGARHGLRFCVWGLAATAAALTVSSDDAVARRHHRVYAHHHHHHHSRGEAYDPPYSSIVVDGNSGATLEAVNPDSIRHPASLTKVMTLYLLFERLDAGRVKLDTPLPVSEHASEQDPTKLGLKPGQTITVEDAIKGIVTRSANDAAVVIAEYLGGSEKAFAKMMTEKAHALGMARTTYVNASGLPDDDQNTTARDQALLGRAIQDRFPRYYRYFSTQAFVFRGETIRGHDHLLSEVEGVDGIKTGFTRASGFNLLTSLHRDGRFLVAVVMGGPSSSERDARMRELIANHIKEAAVHRTAPVIADASARHEEPLAFGKSPITSTSVASRFEPAPATTASVNAQAAAGSTAPIKPVLVRTISYRTVPVQTASLAPMPMLVPVAQPAKPNTRSQVAAAAAQPQPTVVASAAPAIDVKAPSETPRPAVPRPAAPSSAAPQPAKSVAVVAAAAPVAPISAAPPPARPAPAAIVAAPAPGAPAPVVAAAINAAPPGAEKAEMAEAELIESAIPSASVHAHGGWLIQIGAFDDETDARQHLSAAQIKVHGPLASKDPFTERIQKGDKALYRARFAGFDEVTAKAACKELKRSDFQCMALKD